MYKFDSMYSNQFNPTEVTTINKNHQHTKSHHRNKKTTWNLIESQKLQIAPPNKMAAKNHKNNNLFQRIYIFEHT